MKMERTRSLRERRNKERERTRRVQKVRMMGRKKMRYCKISLFTENINLQPERFVVRIIQRFY